MLKRDDSIDIIKGIGIILMVCGHCYAPFTHFIYLFHMAIFFIASGYCFKIENSINIKNTGNFIKRKFKSLWYPYVAWTSIFSISHNLFLKFNIYTNNTILLKETLGNHLIQRWSIKEIIKNIFKSFFLHGSTQMGSAFWFIATLMEISVLYCIINYIIIKIIGEKNIKTLQGICSIVFLTIGYFFSMNKFECGGLDKVFSYYILFFLGVLIRNNIYIYQKKNYLLAILIAVMILLMCNIKGSIALNNNQYCNPVFLLVTSLSGWIFLYGISSYVKQWKLVKKILISIGQNSLAIVILHFLCFKVVNYFGIMIDGKPKCLVAAFPVLYKTGCWWIIYSIVGVLLPVILNVFWKKMKDNKYNILKINV